MISGELEWYHGIQPFVSNYGDESLFIYHKSSTGCTDFSDKQKCSARMRFHLYKEEKNNVSTLYNHKVIEKKMAESLG